MRVKLDKGAYMPTRSHREDAGWDLRARESYVVRAHGSAAVDTGVRVELPAGTVGMIKSRSGLNTKHGIVCEGVVDEGYTGPILVKLYNHSDVNYVVEPGDRIGQLVVLRLYDIEALEEVDELVSGERGDNGFGSSGQ